MSRTKTIIGLKSQSKILLIRQGLHSPRYFEIFVIKKYKWGCDGEKIGIFTTYHHPRLHHHQDTCSQETPLNYYNIKVDIGLKESEPLMTRYSPK